MSDRTISVERLAELNRVVSIATQLLAGTYVNPKTGRIGVIDRSQALWMELADALADLEECST